jgi:hypothetical protein
MNNLSKWIVLIFLFFSTPSIGKVGISVNTISHHFFKDSALNNINIGLGVNYNLWDFLNVETGFYYNSYKNISYYQSIASHLLKRDKFNILCGVVLATGYDDFIIIIIPGIVFKYKIKDFEPRLFVVPYYKGVVSLSFTYYIK